MNSALDPLEPLRLLLDRLPRGGRCRQVLLTGRYIFVVVGFIENSTSSIYFIIMFACGHTLRSGPTPS